MPDAEPSPEDDLEAAREAARRDFAREQAQAASGRRGGLRRRKAATTSENPPPASGYARGRARDEAIRAQLTPLGPDERPLGIKLAVALALLLALGNVVALAAGSDENPALGVVFAIGLCGLAAGMWARIYVVILLFEALLALTIIICTLSLILARTVEAALFVGVLIVLCAPVFWLLIRVMARLQVPRQ